MAPDSSNTSALSATAAKPLPAFYKGRSAWYRNSRHIQMTGINSYRVGNEQVSLKPFKRDRDNAEGKDVHNEWREMLKQTPIVEKPVKKLKVERPPLQEISLRKQLVRHVAQRDELDEVFNEQVETYSQKKIKEKRLKLREHNEMLGNAILNDIVEVILDEIPEIGNSQTVQVQVPLSPVEEKIILEAFGESIDSEIDSQQVSPVDHEDSADQRADSNSISSLLATQTEKENDESVRESETTKARAFISVTIEKRYEEIEAFFTLGAKPLPYPGPSASFTFSLDYQKNGEETNVEVKEKSFQTVEVEETVRIKRRKVNEQNLQEND